MDQQPTMGQKASARRGGGISVLICLFGLLTYTSQGAADIYQYVDEDGDLYFTTEPPKTKRGWKRVVRSRQAKPPRRATPNAKAQRAKGRPTAGQATPGQPMAERPASVGTAGSGRADRYDHFFEEAATLYQLPPALIRAVTRVESNFVPEVVSHKGAMGLMQLMPATATGMGVQDPFDPRQNILGGARYLRLLANRFQGDLVLTLAAYNAGHGAVLRYGGVPPYAETRRYVQRVIGHYYSFRERS